ncbi:hypothetical protein AB1N83_010196 [Pleurotus pulmonarius]
MTLLSWFATESVYTAPARRGWTCHPAWNGDDSEDAIGLERWLSRHGSTIPGIKNSTIRISRDVRENDSDTMFPCVNLTLSPFELELLIPQKVVTAKSMKLFAISWRDSSPSKFTPSAHFEAVQPETERV